MSFRAELREALNDVVPTRPTPGMRERVLQTTLAGKRRQRKEPMTYRLRIPLALVAAVLLVAVAAAALVTWNALHTSNVSPAGDSYATQVAQLEARPLHLPAFQSRSNCVNGQITDSASFGVGPMLSSFGPQAPPGQRAYAWTTTWGYYLDYVLYSDRRTNGPVLVRARDLFTPDRVVFIGQFGAGAVIGSDVFDGPSVPQRSELLLDANQAKATVDGHGVRHPLVWNFTGGVAKDSSSSSGWQIDGVDFSEVIVIC